MATNAKHPRQIHFDEEENEILRTVVDQGFAKSIHAAVRRAVREGIPAIMGGASPK